MGLMKSYAPSLPSLLVNNDHSNRTADEVNVRSPRVNVEATV